MSLKIKQEDQGASVQLTVLLHSKNNNTEMKSNDIYIQGGALIKFCFKQTETRLVSDIMIKKRRIDYPVIIEVASKEFRYHTEKICPEQEFWDKMGALYYYMRLGNSEHIFLFTVTVCAYAAETTALERLYKDADTTDFRLSTTEGSVSVHKACLVIHSEFFKKMLSGEWKETGEGSMQLPGVTLQTLQDLKQYMYLGTLPNDGLLPLLELASCYLIKDLRRKCSTKLARNVKAEDYYSLLCYSIEHKIPELTFDLIQTTPQDVVEEARNKSMEIVNDEAKEK